MTTETQVAAEPSASVFTLTDTRLLSLGRSDRVVARSEDLTARIKVYAEGGENVLHTHRNEDHLFLVLAGQATFRLGREEKDVVVNRNEGVLLPKGAFYWFQSTGDENLVMFRVGCTTNTAGGRVDPDGQPLHGASEQNKHVDGVPVPGMFFGS